MLKKWLQKLKGDPRPEENEAKDNLQPEDELLKDSQPQEPIEPETTPSELKTEEDQTQSAPAQEKRFGLFKRLKERMEKTRSGFVRQMDQILLGRKEIDQELVDDLEEILVTADMGVDTVQEIFDEIRDAVKRKELSDPQVLRERLKQNILQRVNVQAGELAWAPAPFVVLMIGVNGVGKTTTIAKLAYQLKQEGKSVLLVAGDTFRAAAAEQLETWGKRIGVPVIRHGAGADPSAVVFDGLDAAIKRNVDVVLIDTAGRLHTKVNLMEELKKIKRVIGRKVEGAPHETFLVLDATTGQNAVSQARLFREATGISGIVLTKLDGTAKGGIVVSIANQMNIPIRFIGIGEKMEDLRPFDPEEFVKALFDQS